MLMKLALSGMKQRRRDYFVLFSGLIFSIAIFYMFETIATNKAFIESTSSINILPVIFHLGSILLAIITLVYIIYANSFLLSLREREFGMYMMLGAKKSKIRQIMFGETLVIGLISIISGIVVGAGISAGVSQLLMHALDFQSKSFQFIHVPSIIMTAGFFAILFLLSSLFNAGKLSKTKLIQLLKGEKQVEVKQPNKKRNWGLFVLALLLLFAGYLALYKVGAGKMTLNGIVIALVTIPGGTYLVYATVVPKVIASLRNRKTALEHGLTVFTYGQIEFRMNQYARMLAVVTMLLALALGSVTVGLGFKNNAVNITRTSTYYDTGLQNPTEQELKLLDNANSKSIQKTDYHFKEQGQVIYFLKNEMIAHTPGKIDHRKKIQLDPKSLETGKLSENWEWAIRGLFPYDLDATVKVVDPQQFSTIDAPQQTIMAVRSSDFRADMPMWNKLRKIEIKKLGIANTLYFDRYYAVQLLDELAKGTEFMGFFLGVSFLAMMASTLMFKILTGATADIKRYEMLRKIGAQRWVMVKAIAKENLFLFGLPALLGLIHVIFGLQMFKALLDQPYYRFWVPVLLLAIIYSIYYLITVWMYKSIVLGKRE